MAMPRFGGSAKLWRDKLSRYVTCGRIFRPSDETPRSWLHFSWCDVMILTWHIQTDKRESRVEHKHRPQLSALQWSYEVIWASPSYERRRSAAHMKLYERLNGNARSVHTYIPAKEHQHEREISVAKYLVGHLNEPKTKLNQVFRQVST